MKTVGGHDQIKAQIVAFLFNNRADVLRDEMYRALCLHVLHESEPCNIDQLVELVAYAIGPHIEITNSLKTIILDEVSTLVKDEIIQFNDGLYSIEEGHETSVPDKTEEDLLNKKIFDEIKRIALTIKPTISQKYIRQLFDFYLYICNLVAEERMSHVAAGDKLEAGRFDTDKINVYVEQARKDYQIDQIIDSEKFIDLCFVTPTEILSNYEFTLIQVNIIMQLLTWDPALENIQTKVLGGKTLYLDSSVLFSLMLSTSEMNEFLTNMLITSKKELNVKIKVHENTLTEYDNVIKNYGMEFTADHQYLRQLAQTAKKDGINPSDLVDNHVFSDYLSKFSDHIDLGSWQRYTNIVGKDALVRKLKELGVYIDKQNAGVPYAEFQPIKEDMIRASSLSKMIL